MSKNIEVGSVCYNILDCLPFKVTEVMSEFQTVKGIDLDDEVVVDFVENLELVDHSFLNGFTSPFSQKTEEDKEKDRKLLSWFFQKENQDS